MPPNLEERIKIALSTYHASEKPNLAQIAREFDVPYQTMQRRVRGRGSRIGHKAGKKALDPSQEAALIRWVEVLDQAYSPLTAAHIRSVAIQMIQRHNPERTLGRNWGYEFIAKLPPKFSYTIRPNLWKRLDTKRLHLVF